MQSPVLAYKSGSGPSFKPFQLANCPICESDNASIRYPIDINYIRYHTGIELSPKDVGVAKCLVCGHQFISPCPTPEFLSLFYSSYMSAAKGGFYRIRLAKEIPESFKKYYSPWLELIREQLSPDHPALLDIGCGLGMFLRLAREHGFKVQGVEPNAEATKRLDETYSIHAYNCLLEDYSGEESFDVITMWDILEHLAHPDDTIKKVFSMLKPEGLLVLEIPVRDCLLHRTAKALYLLSFGVIKRPLFLICGIHHLQYFSERSITSFLEDHGFNVLIAKRSETDLGALSKKDAGIKGLLYNFSLRCMFLLARLLGRKNKLVMIAKKSAYA